MRSRSAPFVVFAVAAGPEVGFGHLMRARRLRRALGGRAELVLAGPAAARDVALAFGWTVHQGTDVLGRLSPDLLIVDDPSASRVAAWVAQARRLDVPVVVIEDGRSLGRGATLVVDGHLAARPLDSPSRLSGPAFALIDPRTARVPRRPHRRTRVLVTLGGGIHAQRFGRAVAEAVVRAVPGVHVDITTGFVAETLPVLPAGCRWIRATQGLADALSRAAVAVVAGGVTLQEACAAGCPSVAVAVVPAQSRAVRAAAAHGAVCNGGALHQAWTAERVARAVVDLLSDPVRARALGQRGTRLVDGRGLSRVARRIRALVPQPAEGWRDAA